MKKQWPLLFFVPALFLMGGDSDPEKLFSAQLFPETIEAFSKLPQERQKKERLLLARALFMENRFNEAKAVLARKPLTEEERLLLIKIYLAQNDLTLASSLAPEKGLLRAIIDYRREKYEDALNALLEEEEGSDTLYWRIKIQEKLGASNDELLQMRSQLLMQNRGPYHAETSFRLYSWQEYLQGEKRALKHLNSFVKEYPDTFYTAVAYYLLGLDASKERMRADDKKIHSENPESALQYFDKSQEIFEKLAEREILPPYFQEIYQELCFEKMALLLQIAKNALAAKRELYLTYAEKMVSKMAPEKVGILEVELLELRHEPLPAYKKLLALKNVKSSPSLLKKEAEILFQLDKKNESLTMITTLLKERRNDLTTGDRVELLLIQSQIYEDEGDLTKAILALSEAIYEESASTLHYKAIYQRAHLFEKLGRLDLAKKQYFLLIDKGGPFADEARINLETINRP